MKAVLEEPAFFFCSEATDMNRAGGLSMQIEEMKR
jgi:hypothetical protein